MTKAVLAYRVAVRWACRRSSLHDEAFKLSTGQEAMDRLLFIFLVTLSTVLTPMRVHAQSAGAVYTVAGDVDDAQNVVLAAGQKVTVRDLLTFTGQNKAQGNAFILRGQPIKSVWNEHFNPLTNSESKTLQSGDVVVFRALAGSDSGTQNVILMTDGGNDVLQFGSQDRLQLGQLFEGQQPAATVSVVRTSFESAQVSQFNAAELLAHGDVIDARIAVASSATGSQIANSAASQNSTNGIATQNAALPKTASVSGLTIPGIQAGSATLESPFDLASNTSVFDDAPQNSPFAIDEFTAPVSELTTLESTDQAQTSAATSEPARNGSMWNALFVLGLVFALGLIVIGWVKTQQERRQEMETSEQLRSSMSMNSRRANSTSLSSTSLSTGSSLASFAEAEETSVDDAKPEESTSESTITKDITDELWVETEEIATTESPAEDLVNTVAGDVVTNSVDEDCPILSVGAEFPSKDSVEEDTFTMESLNNQRNNSEPPPAIAEAEVSHSMSQTNALVGSDEWFGADWRTQDAKANVQSVSQTEAESLLQSVESSVSTDTNAADHIGQDLEDDDSDVDDTVVEVREIRRRQATEESQNDQIDIDPSADRRNDLEQLIHNRLPINLQQVELPLRINLFGKPSGPKRLRIDGAHTQIAPPHMKTTASAGRRPQTMTVSAAKDSVMESKPKVKSQKPAPSTNTGLPGLDKALNFLDEQADS